MWKWTLKQLFGTDIPLYTFDSRTCYYVPIFYYFFAKSRQTFFRKPPKKHKPSYKYPLHFCAFCHTYCCRRWPLFRYLIFIFYSFDSYNLVYTSFLYFILLILTNLVYFFVLLLLFFLLMPFIWYMYIEFILWLLCHVMINYIILFFSDNLVKSPYIISVCVLFVTVIQKFIISFCLLVLVCPLFIISFD